MKVGFFLRSERTGWKEKKCLPTLPPPMLSLPPSRSHGPAAASRGVSPPAPGEAPRPLCGHRRPAAALGLHAPSSSPCASEGGTGTGGFSLCCVGSSLPVSFAGSSFPLHLYKRKPLRAACKILLCSLPTCLLAPSDGCGDHLPSPTQAGPRLCAPGLTACSPCRALRSGGSPGR